MKYRLLLGFILLASLGLLNGCSSIASKSSSELNEVVNIQSKLGQVLFNQAKVKNDFFNLANNFTFQPNKLLCGPTTISIILNALDFPNAPYVYFHQKDMKYIPNKMDPKIRRFTPRNVLNSITHKVKTSDQVFGKLDSSRRDFGLQLTQLDQMFKAYGVKSKKVIVADEVSFNTVRKLIVSALSKKKYYVIVNYLRKPLGQPGGGHISPLGAYDAKTDSVLIMDVNPSKANWVWVSIRKLYNAMKTYDTMENRGFVIVKR